MCGAKSIVNVEVGEAGQLPGEGFVVGFLLRMEAKIFQQKGLAFFQLPADFFRLGTDAIRRETHVFAPRQFPVEQHSQTLGYRF